MKLLLSLVIFLGFQNCFAQKQIPVDSARFHIGDSVLVCSKVMGTYYAVKSEGGPTFLNLEKAYPHAPLVIVIFDKDRGNFPAAPEKLYKDKRICVRARITAFEGKPQIVISSADDIAFLLDK